jgi:hypothetical protein
MPAEPTERPRPARWSLFQRTFLIWSRLHPYNVVYVATVPAPLEADRLGRLIRGRLGASGLGDLEVHADGRRFAWAPGEPTVELRVEAPGPAAEAAGAIPDGAETLRAAIEREINAPFDLVGGTVCPWRFFAVPDGPRFHLGCVFAHVIADAGAMMPVFLGCVEAYLDPASAPPPPAVDLAPPGYARLAWTALGRIGRWALTLPGYVADLLRSVRPPYRDRRDTANGYFTLDLDRATTAATVRTARTWGVTVNDLVVAALARTLGPRAAARAAGRRRKLSVGCIANARGDFGADAARAFGVCLGFFVVTLDPPAADADLRTIARAVRARTARVKAEKLHLRSVANLAVPVLLAPALGLDRTEKLYRQSMPLWAGVSNVNLDRLRAARGRRADVDVLRAVSTGPVSPMAVTVTTSGGLFRLGVSYRTTTYTEAEARAVGEGVAATLRALADGGEGV